jgi:pteridine reductase
VEIEGKVALVTGGAKRLGRHIALALAERGAEVVIHYRESAREAHEVLALLKKTGGKPVAVQGDVSIAGDVDRIVETAMQAFGRIEILVNSAALFYRTPFESLTEADWDRLMSVNLKGPFLLCRKVGRVMLQQGRGTIVNLADIAGLRPWADFIPYSVSKAGLIALTRGLAKAVAPTVRVNAVAPGAVLLPEGTEEEERQRAVRRIPLARLGSPEDIVRAVIYLIESDFITGEVLMVDGGQHLA